jgi:hypothetical protein
MSLYSIVRPGNANVSGSFSTDDLLVPTKGSLLAYLIFGLLLGYGYPTVVAAILYSRLRDFPIFCVKQENNKNIISEPYSLYFLRNLQMGLIS